MEIAIHELTNAILQTKGGNWTSVISAVCSVVSLVAIFILLKERAEKKRPYLQVSFELLRGSLVSLVIRNVGEVPAKLNEINFNEDFIKQLPQKDLQRISREKNKNMSIYPKQQWVLSLGVQTNEVFKYEQKQLEVTLKYYSLNHRKLYTEIEVINFNDYAGFLVYVSETYDLIQEVKVLNSAIKHLESTIKEQNQELIECIGDKEAYLTKKENEKNEEERILNEIRKNFPSKQSHQ